MTGKFHTLQEWRQVPTLLCEMQYLDCIEEIKLLMPLVWLVGLLLAQTASSTTHRTLVSSLSGRELWITLASS